mmetsp:Transcript_9921/g.16545  ORF Transcript_9921/g.16545 Transcript_9921/m.16545 type:complete len:216 (+) Transcript_9921:541-1188(+)
MAKFFSVPEGDATETFANEDKQADEEGESDRNSVDLSHRKQHGQQRELESCVCMHFESGDGPHKMILGVLSRVPDAPKENAVEEFVAWDGSDAHIHEDTVQYGLGHVFENGRSEHGDADHYVNPKVGAALLDHLSDLGGGATALERHSITCRHTDEVCHRADCCGVGERQSKHGADRIDGYAAHKHIEVVAGGLLEVMVLSVDQYGGEVLVEVPK